jgi:glutamine synthetase
VARYAKDVLTVLDENGVGTVHLWFTDIQGQLRGMSISRREMDGVLEEGQGFDGSSIEGFVRIEESDLIAMPDLDTLMLFPWKVGGEQTAVMICDVLTPDGKPYSSDPRYILKRVLARLSERGYVANLGPELEFFYFENDRAPEPIDHGGYFDHSATGVPTEAMKKTVTALETMGIEVECSHHEVSESQQEIDLRYKDALRMADQAITYRFVVKQVALQHGIYATFMPKPVYGVNGSGMHVHQSLFGEGGENRFFDPENGAYHLSDVGLSYVAGLLQHVSEITVVTNQWVNSYKRLVVGYEAPVYISWGQRNRSSLVRVPMYKPDREKATRVELRSPDPACNPYLAFAVMLEAGLRGIENDSKPPLPIEDNIFAMSDEERAGLGIDSLPGTLEEAIEACVRGTVVRDVLGEEAFEKFIGNKRVEWDRFRTSVTDYEVANYLPVL